MVILKAGDAEAHLSPELGGALLSYQTRRANSVYHWLRSNLKARHPTEAACFVMAPYCSRIAQGRFSYHGEDFKINLQSRLPKTRTELDEIHLDNALHGSAWLNPWRILSHQKESCCIAYEEPPDSLLPFAFRIRQDLRLTPKNLRIELTLTNLGNREMPFGLGLHPYFPVLGKTQICAQVGKMWHTQNHMPSHLAEDAVCRKLKTGLDPAQHRLDNTFIDWDGKARISNQQGSLQMEASHPMHLCIYSPNQDFFCVEPVSNPANAFNMMQRKASEHGLLALAPQKSACMQVCFIPQTLETGA